jgi:hypothetical protein
MRCFHHNFRPKTDIDGTGANKLFEVVFDKLALLAMFSDLGVTEKSHWI